MEKPISIQLSEELTKNLEFSKPKPMIFSTPKIHENFKYQSDCDKDRFQNNCNKYGGESWVQIARMLANTVYTKYIKDPFNNYMTMSYLNKTCLIPKMPLPKMVLFYHHMVFPLRVLHQMLAPLKKGYILLMIDTTMYI